MSFIKITKSNTDNAHVRLHPSRSFASSSSGITGSVRVIAQASTAFKDVVKVSPFVDTPQDDSSLEEFRKNLWVDSNASDFIPPAAATGTITTLSLAGLSAGATLTFSDATGGQYSASVQDVDGSSPESSTATKIVLDLTGPDTSTVADFAKAINESISQAAAFGTGSITRNTRKGNDGNLRVSGTLDTTADKISLQMLDVGFSGNGSITGSIPGAAAGFASATGFSGGIGSSYTEIFQQYLNKVSTEASASRQQKFVEVLRFTPTNTLTSDSIRKSVYRKTLIPNYRVQQPDTGFNFTNYQCFNFVSASAFPSASALVYPEPLREYAVHSGFTFSFNIKVKNDAGRDINGDAFAYPAGCVLFRSSSFAVSIVSGSKKTKVGEPLAFRVLLQLSGAASTDSTKISLTSLPEFTFLSSDNVIKKNHWHNVAVSWGKDHNSGTGSFFIDGVHDDAADFTLGDVRINTGSEQAGTSNCVMGGAKFSGSNDSMMGFFNSAVSSEGVYAGGGPAVKEPHNSSSINRLNAEIHDLRIHSNVISPDLIYTGSKFGLTQIPLGMVFYAPGYFVKESPKRLSLLTPFQQETTGTIEPFNVKLSYGVNGRDINVQNFVRDFVQKSHPRLSFLTASTITKSTSTFSADAFLLDVGSNKLMHRARGMFILPSDNGKFVPGWSLLHSGATTTRPSNDSPMSRFVNDLGNLNYSVVSLQNMISSASIFEGLVQVNQDGSDNTDKNGLLQQIMGSSPEDASVDPGSGFTILQRTRDNSSNAVVFFDASNLFYGNRIEPNSYVISEVGLSGTSDLLSMKFKDNGMGGLYRADAASAHATFSRVGDVLYSEGITGIMHPCIPFFGKNSFSVEMRGDQNVHVYEVNVPALAGTLNSSSNPRFVPGARDNYASSYEGNAVGITSILFHDENFNVVARTNLSQPILKTDFDKYLFRVKFDF